MRRSGVALTIVLILFSVPFCMAEDGAPHREAQIERIAGYTWYHWSRPEADTCIIWLGGGQYLPTYVTINPYRLESLNTMRFIEDLSIRYGMLALSEGEISYRVDSRLVSKVCKWIRNAGYTYAFVVGYSTGGIALAYELTVPEEIEAGPDGGVIITAMVNWKEMVETHKTSSGIELYASALNARNVRKSLLLIYGERAWFWHQGEEYYNNLPEEGWRGKTWFQKEWRLITGAEHEVFTIEDGGYYDSKAYVIVVDFLERVRASSLKSLEALVPESLNRYSTNDSAASRQRLEVSYPEMVRGFELFFVNITVPKAEGYNQRAVALYDLDKRSFVTVAKVSPERDGVISLSVVSAANQSSRSLVGLEIVNEDDQPQIIGISPLIKIEVTDKFTIRIETGVSLLQLKIDGRTFTTDGEGSLKTSLAGGNHTLELPQAATLSQEERVFLASLEDNTSKNTIQLSLDRDRAINVSYRTQYLLTVDSEHGSIQGAGWYDANSTATVVVTLDLNQSSGKNVSPIFTGWSDDQNNRNLSRQVFMDSPKTITARWTSTESYEVSVWPWTVASVMLSIVTLAVYLSRLRKTSHESQVTILGACLLRPTLAYPRDSPQHV